MDQQQEKGKAVLKQFAKLKAIRDPLDQEYEDCYDFTYRRISGKFSAHHGIGPEGLVRFVANGAKRPREVLRR